MAVLGTLTKGIDSRRVLNKIDSYGKSRTSIGYNSGKLKNGWDLPLQALTKEAEFVDETFSEGFFTTKYKRLGKYTIAYQHWVHLNNMANDLIKVISLRTPATC